MSVLGEWRFHDYGFRLWLWPSRWLLAYTTKFVGVLGLLNVQVVASPDKGWKSLLTPDHCSQQGGNTVGNE